MCEECGQVFDTIESLKEHQETEREEKELRNKGIVD
jgi:predicted nucleic acid-binding Zn ribbon protein